MERELLVKKLEMVSRALANDNLVPLYQCFMFDGETVAAFNHSLAIVAECQTKEAFAVNGGVLLGLLQNSSPPNVDFTINGHDLLVKTGKSLFTLPFSPKDDFLFTEPDCTGGAGFAFGAELIEGLSACMLTTSNNEDQRAFRGIVLNQDGKKVTLYSTDGDSISRFRTSYNSPGGDNHMLPRDFCEALIKAFKETEATAGTLSITDEWCSATLDTGYSFYGVAVVIDQMLDHEEEIQATLTGKFDYKKIPPTLDAALSRALVIGKDESAVTKLTINGAQSTLLTKSSIGVVEDRIAFEGHKSTVALISAEFMQRCIGLCQEMTVFENCCCYRRPDDSLFIVAANMGA